VRGDNPGERKKRGPEKDRKWGRKTDECVSTDTEGKTERKEKREKEVRGRDAEKEGHILIIVRIPRNSKR
jgi:hypothetical protein